MASFSLVVAVLVAAVLMVDAGGHGQEQGESRMARSGWGGQQQGMSGMARGGWGGQQDGASGMARGGWGGQRQGADQGNQGWGRDQQQGWNQGRQGGADSRYRSNILDDDDVYGYEAKYPNGEVLYVNYRNTEARARRGPDFARSNSISARMSGRMGQQEGGFRQGQQNQGGFRQMGAMGMEGQQQQGQW